MQLVPAKPRSAWRVLILSVAALLTFGALAPTAASAHGTAWLRVHDKVVFLHHHGGYMPYDQGGQYRTPDGYRFHHKYVPAYVKVTLNKGVNHKVSVGWYTKSGTARAWKDFVPAGGRVYFKKWQKVAYVKVLVKDDFQRRWMQRDRCQVKPFDPNTVRPAPEGYQPRPDGYGDQHRRFDHKFFMVKLVHPHGAGIAEAVGIVKIISKDFRYGDRDGRPMPPRFDGQPGTMPAADGAPAPDLCPAPQTAPAGPTTTPPDTTTTTDPATATADAGTATVTPPAG